MRKSIFIIVTTFLLLLTACSSGGQIMDGDDMFRSYTRISQEEAKKMMEREPQQAGGTEAVRYGLYQSL